MIKKEWLTSPHLTLWQKIRLIFTTKQVIVDISKNGDTSIMWYKEIDGKIIWYKHEESKITKI